jgi:hypothetical protein
VRISHINNKAVAAVLLLRGLDGSDADVQAVYADLQARYKLPNRPLKPSRIGAIQAIAAGEAFAYLMRLIADEKKAPR